MKQETRWQEPHYKLTLELSSFAAEMFLCGGDTNQCQSMINEILQNAKSLQDKMQAHFTHVELMGSQNELDPAIDEGFRILKLLGITFPKKPGIWHVLTQFYKTNECYEERVTTTG